MRWTWGIARTARARSRGACARRMRRRREITHSSSRRCLPPSLFNLPTGGSLLSVTFLCPATLAPTPVPPSSFWTQVRAIIEHCTPFPHWFQTQVRREFASLRSELHFHAPLQLPAPVSLSVMMQVRCMPPLLSRTRLLDSGRCPPSYAYGRWIAPGHHARVVAYCRRAGHARRLCRVRRLRPQPSLWHKCRAGGQRPRRG